MNDRFPDIIPEFAPIFAAKLMALRDEEGPLEYAHPDARIRHSNAGKCSRNIQYAVQRLEPSNPIDEVTAYTFAIGTLLHEEYQKALQEYCDHKGYKVEIEKKVFVPESYSAGHLDAYIDTGTKTITIEVKTINGTGYKSAVGVTKSRSIGPRYSALLQGAINARAVDSDELKIVYLPLESISQGVASRSALPNGMRAYAEWTFTRAEYAPFADGEMERFRWIVNAVDRGESVPRLIPDPELPDRAVVIDASDGTVQGADGKKVRTWHCEYCDYQKLCVKQQAAGD